LIFHNPDYWGAASGYGKSLTETRLGRLVTQAAKVTSIRRGGVPPRGYLRSELEPVWRRLGIAPPPQPDEPDEPDEPDDGSTAGFAGFADFAGFEETPPVTDDRLHDGDAETPQPGLASTVTPVTAVTAPQGLCPRCDRAPARRDTGLCDFCSARQQAIAVQLATLSPTTKGTAP
jgi:hypothetical protein